MRESAGFNVFDAPISEIGVTVGSSSSLHSTAKQITFTCFDMFCRIQVDFLRLVTLSHTNYWIPKIGSIKSKTDVPIYLHTLKGSLPFWS